MESPADKEASDTSIRARVVYVTLMDYGGWAKDTLQARETGYVGAFMLWDDCGDGHVRGEQMVSRVVESTDVLDNSLFARAPK